jgi:hypothetical protein
VIKKAKLTISVKYDLGGRIADYDSLLEMLKGEVILYSLVVTAKANGRDPLEYLQSALDGIALVKTADDLEALLPTSTMVN